MQKNLSMDSTNFQYIWPDKADVMTPLKIETSFNLWGYPGYRRLKMLCLLSGGFFYMKKMENELNHCSSYMPHLPSNSSGPRGVYIPISLSNPEHQIGSESTKGGTSPTMFGCELGIWEETPRNSSALNPLFGSHNIYIYRIIAVVARGVPFAYGDFPTQGAA